MAIKYNDLYMDLRRRLREAGAEDAGRHGQSLHRREQDARTGSVQLPGLGVESWVVADIPARDHQMGQTKDVLPAVPPVEAQQHIAAHGHVQLGLRVSPGQHFQREHRIVASAQRGLLHLPAADAQRRNSPLRFQCTEARAHLHPGAAGGGGGLLEGGKPRGHHHHPVRAHPGSGGAQIVQVAVVGRVKGAAVQQKPHFSRSA